jgi:conserved oligomeric Golgi complex subunit 3
LLTKALTLIRVHFTNALREIAADVSKRIADRQLNDTTMSVLLYGKFKVPAAELKQLGLEIQKRVVPPPGAEPGTEGEYQSLMNELYQSYSATRGRLILPIVTKRMGEISLAPSTSKDVVAFARSAISFVRGICLDEYDLYGEWFDTEGGLYDFLESIIEPMYDYLRPRTIHETQLTKLCELCTLIQTRYMDENEDEDEEDFVNTKRLDFTTLIQPALSDAQTRLVFLTLKVVREDIERYKPKQTDLDYPRKSRRVSQTSHSGHKDSNGISTQMPIAPTIVEAEGEDGYFSYTADTALQDCYPTLQKAIWLLGKIYRLVNVSFCKYFTISRSVSNTRCLQSTVFDDLAHQITHHTTASLLQASTQLTTRTSPTDAQLFLITHFLTLKQQIVAFDIEYISPEVSFDFSNLTSTFYELRSRGGLFNPRNWPRLINNSLIPRVVENMLDAKAELDGRLRSVINEFTTGFVNRITSPIGSKEMERKAFDPAKATMNVRTNIERDAPFLRRKLDEYIDDGRTKETLVAAVQDQVVTLYEDWYDLFTAKGGLNGKVGTKGRGKGREDDVWDPQMFGEWCEGVFKVGRIGLGIGGINDGDDSVDIERESVGTLSRSGST